MREATALLDGGPVNAQVVLCPSCATTLVIPNYSHELDKVKGCPDCKHSENCYCSTCSCSNSSHPTVSYESNSTLTVDNTVQFWTTTTTDSTNNLTPIQLNPLTPQQAIDHLMAEAGRRNSAKDETLLKQIKDLIKQLGVTDDSTSATDIVPDAVDAVTESAAEEPTPVVQEFIVESDKPSELVTFQEGGSDQDDYVSLREADAVFDDNKREIIITPIRPGWGNKRDKFWYTDTALKEAVQTGVFGKNIKMYANHPTPSDEKARPERNVWDWVSTVKETWWDDKVNKPKSRIKVYDERFWERAKQAPDEIAFSIIGKGRSRPGRVENEEARIVESLNKIQSVDWVTEAGAGGAIDSFAESAHEEFEMDLEKLTAEQLREARPDLVEAILAEKPAETPETPVEETPVAEAAVETPVVEAPVVEAPVVETPVETPVVEAAAETPVVDTRDAELEALRKENAEFKSKEADAEKVIADKSAKDAALKVLDAAIAESDLPSIAKDAVRDRFAESSLGNGYVYSDDESLKAAVEKELGIQAKVIEGLVGKKSRVTGMGDAPKDHANDSVRESVRERLAARFGDSHAPAEGEGSATPEVETVETEAAPVKEASRSIQDSIAARLLS